jgi:predicted dehydrogenase
MKVALVGCGNIAARYAKTITAQPRLELVGATDVVPGRAAELVGEFGGLAYASLDALLADDNVDTVVNLTAPQAHAEVSARSLEAGKHVHTEKPVALNYEEARGLAELAEQRGVRLSAAPATLLGEAQQTAWKHVRDGAIGTVRAVYAEANWGRIETWHPSPQGLYAVGPVVDVGIYPLTILTAMFGPARRVVAYGTLLEPARTTLAGEPFSLETPDLNVALVELDSGAVVRLTATFWVRTARQRGIEFHGERATLHLGSWMEFDSSLEQSSSGDSYTPVPLLREPYKGIDWSRALVDLDEALEEGRPHRASAYHAAHVVEVLGAIADSAAGAGPVEVRSTFEPPAPMEWAA